MFKASLGDPKVLRVSIDTISNMIDEAGIIVTNEGLKLRAMDPAHVALVDFELSKEAFEEYEAEKELTLGIDLDRFNTVLKRAGASDRISLNLEEGASNLKIQFKDTSTRSFELPLIDVPDEELKIPNLEFLAQVEVDPKVISEGIKDAEIVSDHVSLKTDQEFFYFAAKGDLGKVDVKLPKDETIAFDVKDETSSMFSIEYLKDMTKASDIANSVKLYMGNDIPVKVDFLSPGVSLSFLLAPRIESE